MKHELQLKYGCNPHQNFASLTLPSEDTLRILNGTPSCTQAKLDVFDIDAPRASPITTAYVRAREADPKSSFGDFVAVSETVDLPLAMFLKAVVIDRVERPSEN